MGSPPSNVQCLELVKASKHTSAGDAAQNVCSSSLHQRHESLVLQDLDEAVHGALVLDSLQKTGMVNIAM